METRYTSKAFKTTTSSKSIIESTIIQYKDDKNDDNPRNKILSALLNLTADSVINAEPSYTKGADSASQALLQWPAEYNVTFTVKDGPGQIMQSEPKNISKDTDVKVKYGFSVNGSLNLTSNPGANFSVGYDWHEEQDIKYKEYKSQITGDTDHTKNAISWKVSLESFTNPSNGKRWDRNDSTGLFINEHSTQTSEDLEYPKDHILAKTELPDYAGSAFHPNMFITLEVDSSKLSANEKTYINVLITKGIDIYQVSNSFGWTGRNKRDYTTAEVVNADFYIDWDTKEIHLAK